MEFWFTYIYCSFITFFLIYHSLNFPNNNLISEVNGAQAALWHSGIIVTHGEGTTREAMRGETDSKSLLAHTSLLGEHSSEMLLHCSQWIQIALLSPSFGLLELYFNSYCSLCSSILFCNCGIYSSRTSINPFFLIQ